MRASRGDTGAANQALKRLHTHMSIWIKHILTDGYVLFPAQALELAGDVRDDTLTANILQQLACGCMRTQEFSAAVQASRCCA